MVKYPPVSDFVSFSQLDSDPETKVQCIFFTQKRARCRNEFIKTDHRRPTVLLQKITNEEVCFDLVTDFVLDNCCTQAGHRSKIEEVKLLMPLAQRWRYEIQQHLNSTMSAPASGKNSDVAYSYIVERAESLNDRLGLRSSREESRGSAQLDSTPNGSTRSRIGASFENHSTESQPRYNLRSHNTLRDSPQPPVTIVRQSSVSRFSPHKAKLKWYDSVYHKIADGLTKTDRKKGSVYIFDKPSAHGYVKIGYTSASVRGRLNAWAKQCGYEPNLLYSIDDVLYSKRVETLAHYELIHEWRRELNCSCLTKHQEWFEVSKERAERVVRKWAEFMRRADPYDSNWKLRSRWLDITDEIVNRGDEITAERLLQYCEPLVGSQFNIRQPELETEALQHHGQTEDTEVRPLYQAQGTLIPLGRSTGANLSRATAITEEPRPSNSLDETTLSLIRQLCTEFATMNAILSSRGFGSSTNLGAGAPTTVQLSAQA